MRGKVLHGLMVPRPRLYSTQSFSLPRCSPGQIPQELPAPSPAPLGLRSLRDAMDLGWAGGSKGSTAGNEPSVPKAVQERKGAARWASIHLPRGWQLHRQGCCFALALLQDLALIPTSSLGPPWHSSPACAHPQQHLLGTAGLMP